MSDQVFLLEVEFPATGTVSRLLTLAGIPVPKRIRVAVSDDQVSGRMGIVIADDGREVILARAKVIKI
jgi:hypothetical protein